MVLRYGINVIDGIVYMLPASYVLPSFLITSNHKKKQVYNAFLEVFHHYDYSDQQNTVNVVLNVG